MAAKTLQHHILRLIGGALLVVSLAIIIAVWVSTDSHVRSQVENDLNVGHGVLQRLLETREQQLLNSAEVLTADFGFKQTVASGDSATIQSALINHGERIQADLMALVSLQGVIVASSGSVLSANTRFPAPDMLKAALSKGSATEFVQLDTDLYQVIMLPVRAPVTLGMAVIGFRLNQDLAQQLKQITHLDVTFSSTNGDTNGIQLSTLLPQELARVMNDSSTLSRLRLPFSTEQHYATLRYPLSEAHHISVLLSASVDNAFANFDVLQLEIMLITLIAIVLSLAGGAIFSRKLTNPMKTLSTLAGDIAAGHYRKEVKVSRNVLEIGNLMTAFNTMQADLSEREARIIYQAHHDPLTGLINRQHAITLLDDMLNQPEAPPLMVVVLNILDFRVVNDTFGHHVGDMCLKKISRRLQTMDAEFQISARLAGDEFLLITPQPQQSETDSHVLLELLQQQTFSVHDLEITLKFAIGVAQAPQDADKAATLIQKASIALDSARREKTGIAFYERRVEETHLKRLTLLADLKTALLANDGQLKMYYQPKICTRTQSAHRFEALIRWIHPHQGFVPPDMFIPLAEQAGLINNLTDWVVEAVIKQIGHWKQLNFDAQVAVNLSAQDLSRDYLLDHINDLLNRYDVPAHAVSFEITESEVMRNPGEAIALLNKFREQGFHLAIDDFGTGYSSLSQLKNMPVTELKIDRSFVMQLDKMEDDQIIVRSTIDLAHSFNLEIVAEGVETLAAFNLLEQWGADWIQGYYFSRPIPAPDVLPWVNQFMSSQIKSVQH